MPKTVGPQSKYLQAGGTRPSLIMTTDRPDEAGSLKASLSIWFPCTASW